MKAMVVTAPGGPEVFEIQERQQPSPGPGQVLIETKAAGINRADILMRQGKYDKSAVNADILGLEVAGVVSACGPGVIRWSPGDRVCALIRNGGYAEYTLADHRHCMPIPANMPFAEAASLPEAILTVWSNVFQRMKLRGGENFLVHGGTSGIGITAIQLASEFGAKVYVTAGSDKKCGFCKEIGAEECVNYKKLDFEDIFGEIGMDVILDYIGGDYTEKNIRLLNPEGRLCFIAGMRGIQSQINIMEIMRKRVTITGSMLSPRDDDFKAELVAEAEQMVWPMLVNGRFRTVVYKTFALNDVANAHILMDSSEHIGKIILKIKDY